MGGDRESDIDKRKLRARFVDLPSNPKERYLNQKLQT
jgi:hypothetical protein